MSKILAIETSCDETALSLVSFEPAKGFGVTNFKIEYEQIYSQIELHKLYGGVVPELASREHITALSLLLPEVEKNIGSLKDQIDAIAVTTGPGLKGCLLVGVNFARGLSLGWNKQIISVNHIEGHLYSSFLKKDKVPEYPFMALIVSGGHTELVLVNKFREYHILARTIDDAAGEAFDKSANLLGFEYPGGASLAKLADTVSESEFMLPKVMQKNKDFSFSGLKTAVSLMVQKNKEHIQEKKASACYAIQKAIVDALVLKVSDAISINAVKQFSLVGGVAANRLLRTKLESICVQNNIEFLAPEINHCTDNASMIGYVGALEYSYQAAQEPTRSYLDSEIKPRWPITEI